MRRATIVLIAVVVVVNVAAQAYALPMTRYIRESSSSLTTDTALRFAYFAFMLVTAFVEALLFDEIVYRGAWRRRFWGGKSGKTSESKAEAAAARRRRQPAKELTLANIEEMSDEELDEALKTKRGGLGALIAENSMPFFLALFALLFANYYAFNAINGDFDGYYSKVGHLFTQLRSSDAKDREKAIRHLSYRRHEKIDPLLVERLEKGTAGEKVWAAWALGFRRKLKLPVTSQSALDDAERLFIGLAKDGTPAQKRAAVIALARFALYRGAQGSAAIVPTIMEVAKRQIDEAAQGGSAVPIETIVAIGLVREKSAIPLLGRLLGSNAGGVGVAAAWALGKMQHPRARQPLIRTRGKPTEQARCAIARSLGALGNAVNVSQHLVHAFRRKDAAFRCRPLTVNLRPDGKKGRPHDPIHVAVGGRYRRLILRSLGKVGFLEDAEGWLQGIAAQGSPYHKSVRSYAAMLYRQIRKQRRP